MYSIQSSEDKKIEKKTVESEDYLQVTDLVTNFYTSRGIVKALDKVTFSIRKGEIFGMVGESGCGKSVTALSVMDLVPDPPGRVVGGKVLIDGFNIFADIDQVARIKVRSETDVKIKRNKRALKRHNFILSKIRGKKAGMIFQEPSLALNPVLRSGDQITENILLHNKAEIADSLINRANLSLDDVKKLVNEVGGNRSELKQIINSWCRINALSDLESQIISIFQNYSDPNEVEREIVNLIKSGLLSVDKDILIEARDYYRYKEQIESLDLRRYAANENLDEVALRKIDEEHTSLVQKYGARFHSYELKRIFTKRKVENVFKTEATRRAKELLTLVSLPDPDRILRSYPHELSGGMQQRLMIAIALASNPKLLIADEPTTALDVTTQAQILRLLRNLNKIVGASILFITHDLAVIAEMCNRVAVMYAGSIVEQGEVLDIFDNPKHPYTVGLLGAIPTPSVKSHEGVSLHTIPGSVPNLITPPKGCRFHPRCSFAMPVCSESKPKLVDLEGDHKVACFLYSSEIEA
ncbi:MAG: oligopeptide/dipeptide ABC transporter ATP-binding protein [Thermoplasmataceae archaeon]|jgi:peptide/nickel transport system ATP-binding protein